MKFFLTFAVVAIVVTLALSLYPTLRGAGGETELRAERHREDRGFELPRDFVYNLAAGVISGVVAGMITKRL
jgi:hypothetical protein